MDQDSAANVRRGVVTPAVFDEYRHAQAALQALSDRFASLGRELDGAVTHSRQETRYDSASIRRVRFELLGPFRLYVDSKPVPLPSRGRPVAVLKFLAARGGRATPRELLLDALWPTAPASSAANRLRVAVHGARKLLEAGGADILSQHDSAYGIDEGVQIEIDVQEFEASWQSAASLEQRGDGDSASAVGLRAEQLYHGAYLEDDIYEDWTHQRREYLHDAYLNLLLHNATMAFERGDDVQSIVRCHWVLEHDSCNEEAYRLLMASHARQGQPARALEWFATCASALRAELGIEPSPELVALRQQILLRHA